MKILIKKTYEELSKEAAEIIKEAIQEKPNLVLGLATGSTPIGCYQELIQMHKKGLDFSKVVIFNLDEYLGLPANHPQSYNYFMYENLLNYININRENFHIPDGMTENVEKFCQEYKKNSRSRWN